MITVKSTINLANQSVPNVIPVVQGDTGRSILFTLADFTIPAGAIARYFITKPSGLAVYNDATIDGNTVLVDLTAQSIAEYGDCTGQVRIILGDDIVTSFEFILHVEPFRGIDAIESDTELNIFDQAIEEAVDDARERMEEAAEETIASIPEDYTALSNDVTALKLDFSYSENNIQRHDMIDGIMSNNPLKFEIGSIEFSSSGFNYTNLTNTVRTIQGYTIHLFPGDIIKLTDYSDAKYYVGWQRPTGIYNWNNGWLDSDYTVIEEGYYAIILRNKNAVTLDSIFGLLSLLEIYQQGNIVERIVNAETAIKILSINDGSTVDILSSFRSGYFSNDGNVVVNDEKLRALSDKIQTDIAIRLVPISYSYQVSVCKYTNNGVSISGWKNNIELSAGTVFRFVIRESLNSPYSDVTDFTSKIKVYSSTNETEYERERERINTIPITINNGFLSDRGVPTPPTDPSKQIYTDKIDVNKYRNLCLRVQYPESKVMWIAYAEYDSNGDFIDRVVLSRSDSSARSIYFDNLNVNDSARYISLTMWSYGYENILSVFDSSVEENRNYEIVSHKGYSAVAPEDTLPAYKLSKQMGYTYVETDVQFTADTPPVPVLIHNDTIDATSDGTGSVAEMTYNQLLQYDFGSWKNAKYAGTKIPTFDQFISLCKQLGLVPYIELKSYPTAEQCAILMNIVKKYGMQRHVKWFGRYKYLLQQILALDPGAEVGISDATLTQEMIADAVSIKTANNKVFLMANAGITDALAQSCADSDIPLGQWVIDGLGSINIHPYTSIILTNQTQFWRVFYYQNID